MDTGYFSISVFVFIVLLLQLSFPILLSIIFVKVYEFLHFLLYWYNSFSLYFLGVTWRPIFLCLDFTFCFVYTVCRLICDVLFSGRSNFLSLSLMFYFVFLFCIFVPLSHWTPCYSLPDRIPIDLLPFFLPLFLTFIHYRLWNLTVSWGSCCL